MGLEALPAQWHLLSTSARPRLFFSGDTGLDGSRNLFTRRLSDASENALGGSSSGRSSWRTASPRASVDGVAPTPGFPSRGPWSEKGVKGGPSSSSLRSESPWPGQGFPEQGGPSGLLRWKSEVPGLMLRASRFDECWGDKWRRANDEICEAERYQGFERLDVNVMNPVFHEGQEAGRASFRGELTRHESDESDWTAAGAEASAVEVTAPSFVREVSFSERRQQPQGTVADRVNFSLADRLTDGGGSVTRPASLKRKPARLFSFGGEERSGSDKVGKMPVPTPIGIGGRVDSMSIPDSLRTLRKRSGRGVAGEGVCAIKKAFDSMVSMVRTLQSYTLQMRKVFVSDIDVQQLLSLVHREMHSSFLWLFQQVFSCTPTLMVSMMILFVNFTVFSLGNNVALGVVAPPDPPTSVVSMLQSRGDSDGVFVMTSFDGKSYFPFGRRDKMHDPSSNFGPPISSGQGYGNDGSGGIGGRSVIVAGGEDGDRSTRGTSEWNAMFSEKDSTLLDLHSVKGFGPTSNLRSVFPPKLLDRTSDNEMGTHRRFMPREHQEVPKTSEQLSYQSLREQIARDLELKPGESYRHVEVDQEALRILVAPVSTKMESDDYLCFDRTDLEYQQAIRAESANPMLLANYAQFLYAVRHDYVRAERFFHRALNADLEDGDILTRWASFLWLALKDRSRADKAYRAAIALDPSNPFHAGSYAHFLWHAGSEGVEPSGPFPKTKSNDKGSRMRAVSSI